MLILLRETGCSDHDLMVPWIFSTAQGPSVISLAELW